MKPADLMYDVGQEGRNRITTVTYPAAIDVSAFMAEDFSLDRHGRVALQPTVSSMRLSSNRPVRFDNLGLVSAELARRILTPSVPSIAPWRDVGKTLAQWRGLKDDWDGDDAIAPAPAQFNALDAFITSATAHGIREPRAYIARDGEVGFHWDGRAKATVSFLPSRFLAFCPREGGEPVRVAGPLDLAACSRTLFKALAAVR